jgi:chemotaxis protein MotB
MSKRGGHHGGAWKVAYADFVTAMMALFMVLWLAAQDQKIKEAIERAFRHPFMSLTKESSGLMASQNDHNGHFENTSQSASQLSMLRRLQQNLAKSLAKSEEKDPSVQLVLTSEGLRINIFDRSRKPVFKAGSADFTDYGSWVVSTLAWQISRYENFSLEIEGHTEQGFLPVRFDYSGWELSADRANSGRRKLVEHGVVPSQIRKVAGFADTVPLPDSQPDDPANRRIALLLRVSDS